MKTAYLASIPLILVLLTSCSGGSVGPTPTPVDINALQTAAVQTVVANVTQTALAQPQPTATELLPTETSAPVATDAPTAAASPTASTCDNSAFINDASVPDGTTMTAGQDFIKTWKVKNTGTCTWTTGYSLVFGYSNPPRETMGGVTTQLTAEVAPGSDAEISINLKAPLKPGTYSGYWKLANNNGYPFGEYFTVVIIVP